MNPGAGSSAPVSTSTTSCLYAGLRTKVLLLAAALPGSQRAVPLRRFNGSSSTLGADHRGHGGDRPGAGDISKRLPVESDDEFGRLAEAFNGFAGQIQGRWATCRRPLRGQQPFQCGQQRGPCPQGDRNDQNRSIDEVSATVEQSAVPSGRCPTMRRTCQGHGDRSSPPWKSLRPYDITGTTTTWITQPSPSASPSARSPAT